MSDYIKRSEKARKRGTGGQTMYDDLTRRLRNSAIVHAGMAALMPHSDGSATAKLFEEAADAIEELNSQLDDFKLLCLPLKENRLYKYSDGSFVEVFLVPLPEPPKEDATRDT